MNILPTFLKYVIGSFLFLVFAVWCAWDEPSGSWWLIVLFALPLLIHFPAWFFIHGVRDKITSDEAIAKHPPKPPEKKTRRSAIKLGEEMKLAPVVDKSAAEKAKLTKELNELKDKKSAIDEFCLFFNRTMLLSVVLYCIPWILYSWLGSGNRAVYTWNGFSYGCMLLITIQFTIIAFVNYIMMENPRRATFFWFNIPLLKKGLELCAFWRVAHFFAIFMSISFLFGFAFAFHDLARQEKRLTSPKENRGLYVEDLRSSENHVPLEKALENVSTNPVHENPRFCFYFKSGKAIFIDRHEGSKLTEVPARPEEERKDLARHTRNNEQAKNLFDLFENYNSSEIPRITLVGRADDTPSKNGSYPSNYALSEARINVVRNEITKIIYDSKKNWLNIDWISVPYSNDVSENGEKISKEDVEGQSSMPPKCDDLPSDPESGSRVVEVYLTLVTGDSVMKDTADIREAQKKEFFEKQRYKTPDLMDYMYFSIYTITTTGYGDIKPGTAYSKFLISLENFFEVFFIVCFLNTLIAMRRSGRTNGAISS